MFWGAISEKGKIHFQSLKKKINSLTFSEFLRDDALPIIREKHGPGFCLQLDNAPPHQGHTIDLIEKKMIRTLTWPPQSPDLNPVEQIWLWMATKLKGVLFNNIHELEEEVQALWDRIPEDLFWAIFVKFKKKFYG